MQVLPEMIRDRKTVAEMNDAYPGFASLFLLICSPGSTEHGLLHWVQSLIAKAIIWQKIMNTKALLSSL